MKDVYVRVVVLGPLTIFLAGCADDFGGDYGCSLGDANRTFFRGHQVGEAKRHASDWAAPLFGDIAYGSAYVGGELLMNSIDPNGGGDWGGGWNGHHAEVHYDYHGIPYQDVTHDPHRDHDK
ncbi:MAG: hypothetical protein ABSG31_07820 [Tepidisphaeraceae bacterium]|jgi:hypothetical protein